MKGAGSAMLGFAVMAALLSVVFTVGQHFGRAEHEPRWMFVGECGSGPSSPVIMSQGEKSRLGYVDAGEWCPTKTATVGGIWMPLYSGSFSYYSMDDQRCDDLDECRELIAHHRKRGGECVFRVEKKEPRP